jgi:FkbM family methyltransferase
MESRLLIKKILHKSGIDINFYDKRTHPIARRMSLLKSYDVGILLDVGANEGQYAREMRMFGYAGKLVSFEPVRGTFAKLEMNSAKDPLWSAMNMALGDIDGKATIHLAGNTLSSSLLDMLPSHEQSAPESRYSGTEEIEVRRLDTIFRNIAPGDDKVFLKIDTQGFEKQILDGATQSLPRIIGIQVELSLVPLYKDQSSFTDIIRFLEQAGFTLMSLESGFANPKTGQLLQVDGIFFRSL